MRRVPAVLFVLVVLTASAGVTGAADQVVGRPTLDVFSPDNVAAPGDETTLDVYVSNDGDVQRGGPAAFQERVTTARGVTLKLDPGSAPISVDTGRVPVGIAPEGTSGPFRFSVTVDEDAQPGTYRLPVRLGYTYTRIVTYDEADEEPAASYADATVERTAYLTIRVDDAPRFEVVDASIDAAVGERGTVDVTLRNVGTQPARDASVRVSSPDSDLRFGTNGTTGSAFVGQWRVGDTRTAEFSTTVTARARARDYPLQARVDYTDVDGIERTTDPLTANVRPFAQPAFELRNVSDTLRVGTEGRLAGRLVYTGDRPLRDAVLRLETTNTTLDASEREYPLGDLTTGASRQFDYDVTVPAEASPGPRRLSFVVQYETEDGEFARSERRSSTRQVAPERNVFTVTAPTATFGVDTDNRVVLDVTNVGAETVTDINATLYSRDPLSSDAPHAYVAQLGPNESTAVAFQVSVSDDAVTGTYPLDVQFAYTDADGDRLTSDPAVVGVTVVEEESVVPLSLVAAIVVVVLVGVGWWWVRR